VDILNWVKGMDGRGKNEEEWVLGVEFTYFMDTRSYINIIDLLCDDQLTCPADNSTPYW